MTNSVLIKKLITCTITCLLVFASVSLFAQSIDSFDPSGRITPSAESFAMTKYGMISPSMYTGAMSFSVPIFTYRDPYYTLPISLDYNFDGYIPSKGSGIVGYGWTLNCGGVITREVRGYPDEGFVMQDLTRKGWAQCRDVTYSDSGIKSNYYSPDVGPYGLDPQLARVFTYDGLSDIPVYYTSNEYKCDPAPDLFHFSFCGFSGDFIMLEDGSIRVYNSNVPHGELTVTFTPGTGSPNYAEIIIRTGDGTDYYFGGSINNVETFHSTSTSTSVYPNHMSSYGYGVLEGSPTTSVTAFRLYKIEAPGAADHSVEFVYSSQRQKQRSVSEACHTIKNYSYNYGLDFATGANVNIDGTSVSGSYFSPLESVKVGGTTIVTFTYSTKTYNDDAAAYFNLSGIDGFVISAGIENECPQAKCLSSISIYNSSGQSVGGCTLTQEYASYGTKKMFLSSVSGLKEGRYCFSYDISSLSLPKNDVKGLDHWGYWNGKTITSIRSILKTNNSGYPMNDLYDQIDGTWKEADSYYSKRGALTTIIYPTGGTTTIEYEGNTVGKRRTNSAYASSCTPYEVGGVRVKKLTHSAGSGGGMDDSVKYIYSTTKTGTTSGILTQMPRYAVASSLSYYTGSASAESFNMTASVISYSSGHNGFQTRDGHIGYSSVIEEYADGSWKKYSFSSTDQTAYCDGTDYDEEEITKKVFTPYDSMDYNPSTNIIRPVNEDRMNMRGQLLRTDLYNAANNLKKTVQITYDEDTFTLAKIYFSNGRYYARMHWSAKSPMIHSRTETSYESGGSQVVTTNYTYNALGQVACEEEDGGAAAGKLKTYYKYSTSNIIPAAKTDIIKTRVFGSSERIVSKDQYTYSGSHIRPLSHTQYHIKVPPVTSSSNVFNTGAGDGTSRVTSLSYYSDYLLKDVTLPGGAAIRYHWDGNNVDWMREYGFKYTHYSWKDQVGLTKETLPGGQFTSYAYDSRNRLQTVKNTGNYTTTKYSYYFKNDPGSSPASGLGSDSYVAVDSYITTAGTTSFKDVTYYNGLGYPEQEVMTDWSATGKKLVRPIVYDDMRRPGATRYLPYAVTASNGLMESNAVSGVLSYYQSTSCPVPSDGHPYSTTVFETSPEGRPLTVTKEGDSWVGHPSTNAYAMNGTGDSILKFSFTHNSSNPTVSKNGTLGSGTLLRTSYTDEDGRMVRSYSDAFGRLLCRRVVDAGGSGVHADTYYVYDLRDSLVCVIPPEGTKYLTDNSITSFSFSDSFASDHCFLWWRDGFGRPVGISSPGGGRNTIEYNARGLMTQYRTKVMDGNGFGKTLAYDNYDRITSETFKNLSSSTTYGGDHLYYYYDYLGEGTDFGTDYAFVADEAATTSDRETTKIMGFLKHESLSTVPGLDKTVHNALTRGREYYYDMYGRVIQIVEVDSDGWKARYSTKYDFLGNVTKTVETHTTPGGASTSLVTTYTRDKRGKVLTYARKIGSTNLATFTYTYDNLGRLSGRTTPSRSSESFTYDLHGWMTFYEAKNYSGTTMFSENLYYATPYRTGAPGLWSGLISESKTQLNGSNYQLYDYTYDKIMRLTDAVHYDNGTSSLTNTEKNITYDLNGNVKTLKRYGTSLDDNLTFTYSGNCLSSVSDAVGSASYTYTHDNNGNMTSDSRKNLQISYNVLNLPMKVMSGTTVKAQYEYLPDGTKVSALAGNGSGYKYRGSFVYSVNSGGTETLESIACDEGRITVSYSGSGTASYRDDIHFRDHLGSTRMVMDITLANLAPSIAVLEKSDYTPFGTRVPTSTSATNRWRFSGKEEQVIGGNDLGQLDFGARHYDPWLTRWTTQDPMAGKYTSFTPYSYCAGNPVNLIDPNGLDIWEISKKGRIVKHTVDKSTDAFYLVNKLKDGSFVRSGESVIFNYGTVLENQSQFSDEKNAVFDWFIVRGDSAAESLFKFFADNTTVEWSWLSMGKKGESGFNVMSSSHNNNRDEAMSYLIRNRFQYGYFLRIHTHSHPNSIPYPSGLTNKRGDIGFSRWLSSINHYNNTPAFRIYIKGSKKYIYYGPNSIVSDFGTNDPFILPEAVIKAF